MTTDRTRLYVKGRVLGYTRSKHVQTPSHSILELENVTSVDDAKFYLGKKVAYLYRARKVVDGSHVRVIWGKITRTHGNSGAVRAKFKNPMPTKSFGSRVRIMLFPSQI